MPKNHRDAIESLEYTRDKRARLVASAKTEAGKISRLLAVSVLNQVIDHHRREEEHPTPTFASIDEMTAAPDPRGRA